ncbi:MAG: hypothetical protein H6645_03500 [Caldilineaceae bacterium]|nr:hypothetical protein [Caldilineaceae bacterium]MCB9156164.1 hypothetical protein [Caldilineaceae bacterium]
MTTKISAITIGEYLDYITVLWFDRGRARPPENGIDYLPLVEIMRQHAVLNGELDYLKLAFEYLLNSPEIDCTQFDGSNYPFSNAEIRAMIALAYKTIWHTSALPPQRHDVEIIGEYVEEWRRSA